MSNRVNFHSDGLGREAIFFASHESSSTIPGAQTTSDAADILLRLTVSFLETMEIANVALRPGSSQQGKARRAAVGWEIKLTKN